MTQTKIEQNNQLQKIETEATPTALLQLAVQQNLDIEKLEKLMQLQERWERNIARKEFLKAFCQFQLECPPLEKTKKVAFGNTKYSYAPLGEIAATIKQPMNNNGLSHRWEIEDSTDKITCKCIISHLNGHSEDTTMSAAKDASGGKNEIQQRGSSISYLQRYTLIAALGISTADEDVDGRREETKQESQPLVVPEHWKQKLEKCLTPEDVDQLGKKHYETVKANVELQKLFKTRKEQLIKQVENIETKEPSIVDGPAHELGEKVPDNQKKQISDEQFKSAMKRVVAGELDVYYKSLDLFSLTENQAITFKEVYDQSKKAKKKQTAK